MNKYIIIWSAFLLLPISLKAQNTIDTILLQIESNNTTLSALRTRAEAQKIGNKTGVYLQNPEIGYNYVWGSPAVIGNRTDVSIIQTFDFPSAYRFKSKISNIRNEQAELEYQGQRKAILYEARTLLSDIIYSNALIKENSTRISRAQAIADAFKTKFENGETGILEFNKAMLYLLNKTKDLDALLIERNVFHQQLAALNGGKTIELKESFLPVQLLPAEFDQWYIHAEQTNPALLWLKQEIEASQQQIKLDRALALPKATTGYMSEKIVGESFSGITLGVSIPLWENKNKVKYAKSQATALQVMQHDKRLQFYNLLKAQYDKAMSLQQLVNRYKDDLQSFDNSVLLKKALDMGEITLIEYLMELSLTYTAIDNLLKIENELNIAVANLKQYEF